MTPKWQINKDILDASQADGQDPEAFVREYAELLPDVFDYQYEGKVPPIVKAWTALQVEKGSGLRYYHSKLMSFIYNESEHIITQDVDVDGPINDILQPLFNIYTNDCSKYIDCLIERWKPYEIQPANGVLMRLLYKHGFFDTSLRKLNLQRDDVIESIKHSIDKMVEENSYDKRVSRSLQVCKIYGVTVVTHLYDFYYTYTKYSKIASNIVERNNAKEGVKYAIVVGDDLMYSTYSKSSEEAVKRIADKYNEQHDTCKSFILACSKYPCRFYEQLIEIKTPPGFDIDISNYFRCASFKVVNPGIDLETLLMAIFDDLEKTIVLDKGE